MFWLKLRVLLTLDPLLKLFMDDEIVMSLRLMELSHLLMFISISNAQDESSEQVAFATY